MLFDSRRSRFVLLNPKTKHVTHLHGPIIGLNLVFAGFLFCRIILQLRKRNAANKRNERTPSSAAYSTLAFDVALGLFLIAVAYMLAH